MTSPIISDHDDLLNWMYAPRNGLTTREIGAVIRVSPVISEIPSVEAIFQG